MPEVHAQGSQADVTVGRTERGHDMGAGRAVLTLIRPAPFANISVGGGFAARCEHRPTHGECGTAWRCYQCIEMQDVETGKLVKRQNLRRGALRAIFPDMVVQAHECSAELIRIGELAKLTGLTVSHLRRLADARLIPACRVGPGCHRRFPRDDAVQRIREVIKQRW